MSGKIFVVWFSVIHNAYYIQGKDAWIQVYQIKMRTYKRIPIPDALYKLMKVYLKKHGIKADDYVFQNAKGAHTASQPSATIC